MIKVSSIIITLSALAATAAYGQVRAPNLKAGAVYVLTNQTANSVIAFARRPDGALVFVDNEPTQGTGSPVAIPPDPPTDALASQGSLSIDEDGEYLYAVNAISDDITTLEITPSGLEFVGKVSSQGSRPISTTVYNEVLYVLNEGNIPNISGFGVAEDGSLTPIPGSTQLLAGGALADPAQIGFSPDGKWLVVTEKMGNRIDVYPVDDNGVAGPGIATSSAGMTPFGFAFSGPGGLFVSEAFGATPRRGALSSYLIESLTTGLLMNVSPSIPNLQTASCWVVTTNCGRNIFVSNTGSGTISSYHSGKGATVQIGATLVAGTGPASAPIDMAVSDTGNYLYVVESGLHTVGAFRIGVDSSLSKIGDFGALPVGAQGIVAR